MSQYTLATHQFTFTDFSSSNYVYKVMNLGETYDYATIYAGYVTSPDNCVIRKQFPNGKTLRF